MYEICNECNELTSKYKCPNCNVPYCSADCYKNHKLKECVSQNESPENDIEPSETQNNQSIHLFTTIDTVKKESLQKLGESEILKTLLENPHLRKYLSEIDSAPNAWKAIQAAMYEPLFLEFADECLKVVEDKDPGS